MDRFVKFMGTVAAFCVHAERAARELVRRSLDEFASSVVARTGIDPRVLETLKDDAMSRVAGSWDPSTTVTRCLGVTVGTSRCKNRVMGCDYCELHAAQGDELQRKRRRVSAYVKTICATPRRRRRDIPRSRLAFS